MAEIHKLFEHVIKMRSSDLHLSAGSPPAIRVDGQIEILDHPALDSKQVQALVFGILSESQKKKFMSQWELDCSVSIPSLGRFRCNVFMQNRGLGAVFRLIPEDIRSFEDLGLDPNILKLIERKRGLVLVTGPTGSGKSTTLAAMIDHINSTRKEHIITIEDPIEFVHKNKECLINQREVSSHTKSFQSALKSALREDPDVILVGEMRDLETIHLALTAAETGHLVFGTLHTKSAAKTIDRIIDVFPSEKQPQVRALLSDSLIGVVAQNLLPQNGGGRIACNEILINTTAIANLIREGKTFQIASSMQTGAGQGMITFDSALRALHRDAKISDDVLTEFSDRPLRKAAEPGTVGSASANAVPTNTATSVKPQQNTGIFKGFGKKSG